VIVFFIVLTGLCLSSRSFEKIDLCDERSFLEAIAPGLQLFLLEVSYLYHILAFWRVLALNIYDTFYTSD
jgi:hypothetical protein